MLNIGVIGTGFIAREHAAAIAMLKRGIRLVAASDVSPESLREFSTAFKVVRCYPDPAQLIADPEVDLVAITTPPLAHEALAIAALDSGKYVLCEKPVAPSLASAHRIVEAEARHAGRLAVGHSGRYESEYRRLLWLCQNGWVGEPQSVLIERHTYITPAEFGKKGWWGSWEIAGGGVLISQLIHEIDLLMLVMGRPVSVHAVMDTRYTEIESEDYIEATFRFSRGATAVCLASVNSGRSGGKFIIEGSLGTAALPGDLRTSDWGRARKAIRMLNRALPETSPTSTSLASRGSRFLARHLGLNPRPSFTPHALLYRDIMHNIEAGRPLPIPAEEALVSLEACLGAYESALRGEEVRLQLSSSSTAYHGISKPDYDARKCARKGNGCTMTQKSSNRTSREVRVGFLGLDTSHAPTFAGIFHDPYNAGHIPGVRVVAAYPGGSPDMPISIGRVPGFAAELRDKYGVRIMGSPEEVADACDLIFILSCDGRVHKGLFRDVAGRGKPIFIDKPFATSATDAQEMLSLAAQTGTLLFSSSGYRYTETLVNAVNSIRASGERIKSCRIQYWLQIQETQGRYFWYGIHAAEMLLAIMGRGVRQVEASSSADEDIISVWHEDGRQSFLVGSMSDGAFRVIIETDKREWDIDLEASMFSEPTCLLWAVLDVLTAGQFPRLWRATGVGSVSSYRPSRVLDPSPDETLEVVRVLDAAQRCYAQRGPVLLG